MPRSTDGPGAEFGALLRRLRAAAGLSQAQLGARVHYSKSHLSCVERGRRPLAIEAVARLDEILGGRGELLAAWYRSAGRASAVATHIPAASASLPPVTDVASFAAAMEGLRRASGLSYRDVARRCGRSKSSVFDLCGGRHRGPAPTALVKAFLSAVDVDGPQAAAWLEVLAGIGSPAWDERWRLHRAAAKGDPVAMHRYAEHLRGIGEGTEAERWRRSAAEAGSVEAMIELGTLRRKAGDLDTAAAWWMRAASAQNPTAMNHLALLAANSGDRALAEHWYRSAAAAGSLEAMHNLALIYEEDGQIEVAEWWYGKAARTGDDDAMENLAAIYRARGELPKAGMMMSLARRHRPES